MGRMLQKYKFRSKRPGAKLSIGQTSGSKARITKSRSQLKSKGWKVTPIKKIKKPYRA